MGFGISDMLAMEGDSHEDPLEAMQRAINSGTAWALPGSYGRAMMAAINAGQCMLGTEPARDYYGNYVPSRYEVKGGTKGSFDYVAEHSGTEHAEAMADVE